MAVPIEPLVFGHCSWRLGELTLVVGLGGVCRVYFERQPVDLIVADLRRRGASGALVERDTGRSASASRLLGRALAELGQYLSGRRRRLDVPVDLGHQTAFRKRVLERTRRVPYGATISYGQLAREVQSPLAARAVGGAMGDNPVPVFVPCHRVVASGGGIGGFTGGLAIKRALLSLEGASSLRGGSSLLAGSSQPAPSSQRTPSPRRPLPAVG